ncbi:amino acid adenylation domain-containing protein [Marinimicrobium sp. ABcell2]|uniref:non-ribosomal peptide synthetase n=1 Tax=Marinimicrobium sp. ABcell2 TaxID=3069751 RepID=UPI0027AE6ED3|nr:amino acid adenylation domain-containing protein [Marinimicrobium sp. ABcell2]MDQ2076216.1 amino acid adenylation domain-containing protein [Marinimicrobium sp. ABcell2]
MEAVFKVFERHAQEHPQTPALRYSDRQMSYAAVNREANRLASFLIANDIGRETAVAVFLEPGFEIVTTLLGILKAGGVYVPLDPTHPPARVEMILDDVRPKVIITRSKLASQLPAHEGTVLCLDDDEEMLASFPAENPGVDVHPDDSAYIYYTSGTTGTPKGVLASHNNLCNYLYSARDRYGVTEHDVIPSVARYSFSISMFELMLPLISGARLVLLDRDHILDPHRMLATFREVTFFHIGPSLLRSLVNFIRTTVENVDQFGHVRHASSGGDMVPPELLEELRQVFRNAEVYVIYGCSEVSCMGCTHQVPESGAINKTFVGQPFPGVEVRVLDDQQRVLGPGQVGEVWFAGNGLVKGYLNKPELTQEKFRWLEGRRFYATGDIGRFDAQGDLEMLGRRDFQVQLRGMRVELAEIELMLRRAPNVQDGVVMAWELVPGDKTLVAYPVFAQGTEKDTAAVREYLARFLPDYMVPSRYVPLQALPLNHNMKVDRFALPQPAAHKIQRSTKPLSPETETEIALTSLWMELLRVEDVGREDNFFFLGGYSLLAMEFILRVESELAVTLDGMDVLRENLQVLAAICDRQRGLVPPSRSNSQSAVREEPYSEAFYFGPEAELYGLYYPSEANHAESAVLICPPIGSEWTRTHFVMRKVIRQLIARGVPVMRFDFFGMGDSLGEGSQASLELWKANIDSAVGELKRRAGVRQVVGIGVRLGASLMTQVAEAQPESFSRLVLWDPIFSGIQHLEDLRRAQRRLTKAHRSMLPLFYRQKSVQGEELLAFVYSHLTIAQLRDLDLHKTISRLRPTAATIYSGNEQRADLAEHISAEVPIVANEIVCDWWDISALEDILPDVGMSESICSLVN